MNRPVRIRRNPDLEASHACRIWTDYLIKNGWRFANGRLRDWILYAPGNSIAPLFFFLFVIIFFLEGFKVSNATEKITMFDGYESLAEYLLENAPAKDPQEWDFSDAQRYIEKYYFQRSFIYSQ